MVSLVLHYFLLKKVGRGSSSRSALARGIRLLLQLGVLPHLWLHYCEYLRWRRRPKNAPYFGSFILGGIARIAPAAIRNELHRFVHSLQNQYGKTFVVVPPLGFPIWACITSDPKNVEHILKTNFDNYPKGENLQKIFNDLLGRGIFAADGKEWFQQRKTTSHMFTAKLFKEHIYAVVKRNSEKLCSILKTSDPSKPVDVFNLMNRFTLDTIGEIGFGKSIGSLEDATSPFLQSFDRAQEIVMFRFLNPFWWIYRFLKSGTERDTKEHMTRLDQYSREVARDLQSLFKKEAENPQEANTTGALKSFVGMFLADAQKRKGNVDETQLRDLVLNFLIAGRDTTAQALSWTVFLLCLHPEVEEKAIQEIRNVCGDDGPSYDDLNRMNYLQAVLHEGLRLYPSVPFDLKETLQDDIWPDGTKIKAGSVAIYNIYAMGRDPQLWGDDAEKFRPERWLDMKEFPDNYHYPVFNGGPRECLGRRLALVEMKICLASLLPNVSLKLAQPAEELDKTASQLTIGMAHGLPCFATPRAAK
eukprot:gnl/MRDRNA2_/MRDRNA2_163744_c0_seq1.p1 gnl/MRDRNA2_/MRDRNA2_163744_c0~~gnl/MRDRNA2_/MRDRNA2_163744_c0_seq1.p1  ORF type:complete len:530 (+),score=82.30 gnl/MRDRNA2_/MRDRNA2_163744_c0_seq1:82-1671(+)